MRYGFEFILFSLLFMALLTNAHAQATGSVYISPNAQTGLVSDVVYTVPSGNNLWIGFNGWLSFEFNGAYISELSTIRITCSWLSTELVWQNFTDYGISKSTPTTSRQYLATVRKGEITITAPDPWTPLQVPPGGAIKISGLRCNVVPFTHGTNLGDPITVSAKLGGTLLSVVNVATFADSISSQLKAGPAYNWSNNLWNATATVRVSEAGNFVNAFETQSTGSPSDATQIILSLWGMAEGTKLKNAVVANTTSATVAAAISPTTVFPLSGSPVRIPINILGQSADKLESIDINLTFEIAGSAQKYPPGSVNSTVTLGPQAPFDSSTPLPFDSVPGAGVAGNRYFSNPASPVSILNKVEWPMASVQLTLEAGGAATFETTGESQSSRVGYAAVALNSGADPYGTAVFSFRQNGVTVTEAGVPATPPTSRARTFIDYRSGVSPVAGHVNAGSIDVNTGIAVENPGSSTANVTYTLRDLNGGVLSAGHGTIGGGQHFARFINQLKEIAPDFDLPLSFQSTIQFASLEIVSDQPVCVLALRATVNQRGEFLLTTLPTADLSQGINYDPAYFAQLADGGGYTTSLLLLNASTLTENGTLQILDNNGAPLTVIPVGGKADSSFRYSIPPGGALRLQTDGSPAGTRAGWARLVPDAFSPTPVASGIFSFNPGSILLSESGIPAVSFTTHARVYVDLSGSHNTGLALANVKDVPALVTVSGYQTDGTTGVGTSRGSIQLMAGGHVAKFANEFISGLPDGFTGILDVSSSVAFAVLTLRSLINERGDFLMTTFPVATADRVAPSSVSFPQIADGGGYVTKFVMLSAGRASSVTLSFYDEDGTPVAPRQQDNTQTPH